MIKKILRRLFDKAGYEVRSTKYILRPFLTRESILELDFDHVISKYITLEKQQGSDFKFLQIGAFDGVQADPLNKYLEKFDWHGILLEPQPAPYIKLKNKYERRSNIVVKNVAINSNPGKATLYTLDGTGLPEWAQGMASFSKENILKHEYMFPRISDHIREIEIDTITFERLFEEHHVDRLDLLQIDTEGFDAEVLQMFPFSKIKPAIVHFESKHIPKPVLERLLDKLIAAGYVIASDRQEDMMAVLSQNKVHA